MKICLDKLQKQMLDFAGVTIDLEHEYSEDEALILLDRAYDVEVQYAQTADVDPESRRLATEYAKIADTIYRQIPEE